MAETTVTAGVQGPSDPSRRSTQDVSEESGWRLRAACRGTDPAVFFPAGTAQLDEERAKALCSSCPVRGRCLDYAIEHHETDGIWGGLNREERRSWSP